MASLLPKDEVERPATSDMFSGLSKVAQDVLKGASSLFQSIGQNGEALKGTLLVDGRSEFLHGRSKPDGFKNDGAERIAENV
jgi:hypothetical protein